MKNRGMIAYSRDGEIHDDDQSEFLLACGREKERLRRNLTPAEILRVANQLGYRKVIDIKEMSVNPRQETTDVTPHF